MRYKFKLKEFIHHPIKTEVLEELKWKPSANLEKSLLETITWYKKNLSYF